MKAKDLAALAALGIAGKFAYDKYSEKNAPAKKGEEMPAYKGREANRVADIEAESDERAGMPAYQGRSANRLADIEADNDYVMPRTAPRDIGGMRPEDVGQGGSQSATSSGYNKLRAAGANSKTPAAALTDYVAPRTVAKTVVAAPVAAEDDYVMPRTAPKPVMPDASRVTQYNPDIMYADTVQRDPSINTGSATNQQAYARNKRAGVVPSQRPNDQAQARIARQSASASEIAAREAEIARKEKAFKTMATFDPARASSLPLEASQNMSLFKQMRGRAKGGAVKMAKGGLASSKMSKPSGASRGDGIAQRGRTRGKYL